MGSEKTLEFQKKYKLKSTQNLTVMTVPTQPLLHNFAKNAKRNSNTRLQNGSKLIKF